MKLLENIADGKEDLADRKSFDLLIMEQFLMENQWLIWLILLWSLPWKGVALWRAARNSHKKWFIAVLVINTMAILEIVYIFVFSKKKQPSESS